jgi:hypothetical protein
MGHEMVDIGCRAPQMVTYPRDPVGVLEGNEGAESLIDVVMTTVRNPSDRTPRQLSYGLKTKNTTAC